MCRRPSAVGAGLLIALAAWPAWAHDLPAAELARLDALVDRALSSGWLGMLALIGSGMALGALHGLEPGHAKTMMSAFIIAVRGTVGQAALLGVAATVSHTAVVWLLVVPVIAWGSTADVAGRAPYFQIASAVAVLVVAGWTFLRVFRGRWAEAGPVAAPAAIDTGHGLARLAIEPIDGESRFVVRGVARSGRTIPFHEDVSVETTRDGGIGEKFGFAERDGAQVATAAVVAPHRFVATLRIAHDEHAHEFPMVFEPGAAPRAAADGDAHERAHAEQLRRRLAGGRPLTRWQIIAFGLSGGLLPCPAAVTVLLLCLHLQRVGLGLLLVAAFSVGLALTMIAAGALAAIGMRHVSRRFGSGFAAWSRPATYASCALIFAIGLYMLVEGIDALA